MKLCCAVCGRDTPEPGFYKYPRGTLDKTCKPCRRKKVAVTRLKRDRILQANRDDLTQTQLRSLLRYDGATGTFSDIASGESVGRRSNKGYIVIRVSGLLYSAHRLAWMYVHGAWPDPEIDHRNGVRSDNRIANLREATSAQNNASSRRPKRKGLPRGVSRHRGRFQAGIRSMGKRIHLGTFDSPEDAGAAYARAALKHHGEYAALNRTPKAGGSER